MASPGSQKVNQPGIACVIYEDVMLIEVSMRGADICRTRERPIHCSKQRVCICMFAFQGSKKKFLRTLHRFAKIREASREFLRCYVKQLLVVISQLMGSQSPRTSIPSTACVSEKPFDGPLNL